MDLPKVETQYARSGWAEPRGQLLASVAEAPQERTIFRGEEPAERPIVTGRGGAIERVEKLRRWFVQIVAA
jgi:hypothetical protein